MKILIAVDGSHHSVAALSAVKRRTWLPGTQVLLLAVNPHKIEEDNATTIDQVFEEASSVLNEGNELVITRSVVDGNIRDCILAKAEAWHADLVVVGSRGHSLLENVLLGSVSQSVIDRAKCPVAVVREVQPSAFGNILVAVDDSESSAAAVEWLAMQPWANSQCTIALTSVVHDPQPELNMKSVTAASETLLSWEAERGLLYAALEYWGQFLKDRLPNATIHFGVIDGDAREVLINAAKNWPAECVVMGSTGRRGLMKLVCGSVSQNVASNATCSVEIVRGVPSEHFMRVHEIVEDLSKHNPLLIKPSKHEVETEVSTPHFYGGFH